MFVFLHRWTNEAKRFTGLKGLLKVLMNPCLICSFFQCTFNMNCSRERDRKKGKEKKKERRGRKKMQKNANRSSNCQQWEKNANIIEKTLINLSLVFKVFGSFSMAHRKRNFFCLVHCAHDRTTSSQGVKHYLILKTKSYVEQGLSVIVNIKMKFFSSRSFFLFPLHSIPVLIIIIIIDPR